MSAFPGSPRLLKGGIALLDPSDGSVQQILSLQCNPDMMAQWGNQSRASLSVDCRLSSAWTPMNLTNVETIMSHPMKGAVRHA